MHDIEPFYNWKHLYSAEEDERSPFFNREYSEFFFSNSIYNYLIHPQWDEYGSNTLYIKMLYADYTNGFCIIEMIGEWNDCIDNDIMTLKREVLDVLIHNGIDKFIMIGENVLNYHCSDDSYYEEWFHDIEDGWIVFLNFREHLLSEFRSEHIDYYVNFGGELDDLDWRKYSPTSLFNKVNGIMSRRLE